MNTAHFRLDQTTGRMPFRACRADRRFAYGVYVPSGYSPACSARFRILVAVHGSERAPEVARDLCIDLAEETRRIVLAPLFPVAMTDDEEFHNYLFLSYGGIRFDQVLLAMIEEVASRFAVPSDRLWLSGFSGGGQFAHRFMYLHAARLAAVSVGAPGIVNTLDANGDWGIGVRDVQARFGLPVDRDGLCGLPVQVVVGQDDTLADDIHVAPGHPLYVDGVNRTGSNRVERAGTLHALLCDAGVDSQLDIVPGAGHLAADVQSAVNAFFRACHRRELAGAG